MVGSHRGSSLDPVVDLVRGGGGGWWGWRQGRSQVGRRLVEEVAGEVIRERDVCGGGDKIEALVVVKNLWNRT